MKKSENIKKILDNNSSYHEMLFIRGYLITNRRLDSLEEYPFYGNWKKAKIESTHVYDLYAYYHHLLNFYQYEDNDISVYMVGHAYNPFNMDYDERTILRKCADSYRKGEDNFFETINELTGIHLVILNDQKRFIAVQDCSGMKSCYFGKIGQNIFITSHPQLVADLCKLDMNPFVEKLIHSFSYNIGNRHLPGNITPYKELKRLGGNTFLEYKKDFTIKRFYPKKPHSIVTNKKEYKDGIQKIADIIHKSILLTTKKWQKPAISLSGGNDSKTTLACANGMYEFFLLFSFFCKSQELVDAKAARVICSKLGLPHTTYKIPRKNEVNKDFELIKQIINHNSSYFKNTADHEIRKMIFLYYKHDFDIELKSWAAETTRVFLERKLRIKLPAVLNERHFSIFQTKYFLVPSLLKKSDRLYKCFMKEVGLEKPIFNFEHSDLFYWEVRMGAWGTSVVSSLDFCHNVTMPLNNRKLIELFLSFPKSYRKTDKIHQAVIKLSNKKIHEMHIEIRNLYFHSYRIWLEKLYYYYRTIFYRKISK